MKRRGVLCLLIVLLLLAGQRAYSIHALPAYTIFYMPAENNTDTYRPYIELYWQADPKSIHYKKNEKEIWLGKFRTEIEISCDTGVIATDRYYLQTTPAASRAAAQIQNITDLHRYVVPEQKIYIKLTLQEDGFEDEAFSYFDSVTIEKKENRFYSGIQLLDTSYKYSDEQNMFMKNGRLQVPLCFHFLNDNRRLLHYYVELYGDNANKELDSVVHEAFISKTEFGHAVLGLKQPDTLKTSHVLPISGSIKIDVLPSGNYYLNVIARTTDGTKLTQQALFFQRSNVNPVKREDTTSADSTRPLFEHVELFDLSTTFVGEYTEPQLMAILKMLKPIANETELLNIESFRERPDFTYIRYFIYNFWKSHSPMDPERGWQAYTDRVRAVNKLFGSSRKPGYETERGFYYLKYGKPEIRYTVSSEEGAWPYEVWQYNAPGNQSSGGAMLFYSPGFMVNDYMLLHSTIIGERRNTAWRSQLYKSGMSSGNLNSRAEQVFLNR